MNDKVGRRSERRFAEAMAEKGYFPIFIKGGETGQPCDFAVLGNGKGFLADAKHCERDSFPFSRIEPNQRTAFTIATSRGVPCFFACEVGGVFFLVPWEKVLSEEAKGKKSLKPSEACE